MLEITASFSLIRTHWRTCAYLLNSLLTGELQEKNSAHPAQTHQGTAMGSLQHQDTSTVPSPETLYTAGQRTVGEEPRGELRASPAGGERRREPAAAPAGSGKERGLSPGSSGRAGPGNNPGASGRSGPAALPAARRRPPPPAGAGSGTAGPGTGGPGAAGPGRDPLRPAGLGSAAAAPPLTRGQGGGSAPPAACTCPGGGGAAAAEPEGQS